MSMNLQRALYGITTKVNDPDWWLRSLADWIVLEVGYQHWLRMNLKRVGWAESMTRDDFVAEMRQRGNPGTVYVINHLIARLTPERLALPEAHDIRR